MSKGRNPSLALAGVDDGGATEMRSFDMKFSEVSLTTGKSGSTPVLVTSSA